MRSRTATGALWALTDENRIERIDPRTNMVVDRISRGRIGQSDFGGGVAASANAVWTAPSFGKTLWKIDPLIGRFVGSLPLGRSPAGVAFGQGAVWVAVTR